jgi:hypothetical protein
MALEHGSLILVIAGGLGLLALLRRLSRPMDAASLDAPTVTSVPLPAEDTEDENPALRIRNHYFRTFDTQTGPPDPECFYHEIFVEFENPESGEKWTNSYFVGTPSGIAQMMREEGWDRMFGTDLLIVRRFDREQILRGILDHIQDRYEILPEPPRDPHLG